jgi:hypothetical protein
MQAAGWEIEFNKNSPANHAVTSVKGRDVPVDLTDTNKCYKVIGTLFGNILLNFATFTRELMVFEPKTEDCNRSGHGWPPGAQGLPGLPRLS